MNNEIAFAINDNNDINFNIDEDNSININTDDNDNIDIGIENNNDINTSFESNNDVNMNIENDSNISFSISDTPVGTNNYNNLVNQPKINSVTLVNNKTSEELGLQPAGSYANSKISNIEIDELFR